MNREEFVAVSLPSVHETEVLVERKEGRNSLELAWYMSGVVARPVGELGFCSKQWMQKNLPGKGSGLHKSWVWR